MRRLALVVLLLGRTSAWSSPAARPLQRAGAAATAQGRAGRVVLLEPAVLAPSALAGAAGLSITLTALQRSGAAKAERAAAEAAKAAEAAAAPKREISIGELLREYGVIALLFHFSVWSTSCVVVYTALTLAGAEALDALPMVPADLAGESGSALGRVAATLGLVELVGPARLALTVAVTPAISERARQVPLVARVERGLMERGEGVARALSELMPGGGGGAGGAQDEGPGRQG